MRLEKQFDVKRPRSEAIAVLDDDEALVDSLVRPGHPSTPGYNDPQYPFFGRILG